MKIYFMRHGYAYHNLGLKLFGDVAYNMKEYKDAKLTSEGVQHTIEMGKSFKNVKPRETNQSNHFNRREMFI